MGDVISIAGQAHQLADQYVVKAIERVKLRGRGDAHGAGKAAQTLARGLQQSADPRAIAHGRGDAAHGLLCLARRLLEVGGAAQRAEAEAHGAGDLFAAARQGLFGPRRDGACAAM